MEILREVSEIELDYVIKRLEENLPYTIKDLYYILAARRSKKLSKNLSETSEKVLPRFYVHRHGIKENCTIFGITGEKDHNVTLFTFQESLDELSECLKKTTLIRWKDGVLFQTTHRHHAEPILEFVNKASFNEFNNEEAAYFSLAKEEALKFEIEIPEETEVRQLTEDDVSFCNRIWTYRYDGSEFYIRSLIRLNGGLGLFDKSTNEILSYAVINENWATGMLSTVEHARGKGYAKLISKLIAIKIVQDFDINPLAFINSKNLPSMQLFGKLGYKKISNCNWIFCKLKSGEISLTNATT